VTWTALAPLALPDLPEEIGRRMVEEHLLDPSRFWLPAGVPSVAADERSFQRGDHGTFSRHRYWRGPVWINTGWLLWLGLRRLGYTEQADEAGGTARPDGRRQRPARVLRPLRRQWHGAARVRLVDARAGAAPAGRRHPLT